MSALIEAELDRRRRDAQERRRRAEEARYAGGPCWACGRTSSSAVDRDGVVTADWHTHRRGPECGTCMDWRGLSGTDDELLDKTAAILRDEGLAALSDPNRRYFRVEPGLAQRLGVTAWCDDPGRSRTGVPWGHLQEVENALRSLQTPTEADLTGSIGFNDLARLSGAPAVRSWTYEAEDQELAFARLRREQRESQT
jgi:hypothetical protein